MKSELRLPSVHKIGEIAELAELGKKARIVFHDLSNHITALTLSMDQLQENLHRDSERLLQYSKKSEQTRLHMEHVSSLLKSHITRIADAPFDPNTEIKNILGTFAATAAQKSIQCSFQAKTKTQLIGSRIAFIHCITNLISNALESFEDYSSPSERRINVSTMAQAKTRHFLVFVSDTGSGIRKELLKKIFENNFTTKANGHGIGLYATKQYVEESFRGTITVESSKLGSTFLITIPVSRSKTILLKKTAVAGSYINSTD